MEIIFPAIVAFLITAFSIPLTIKLAQKYSLMDDPKLRPHPAHVQKRVVPRAGGLACFLGLVATILLFVPLQKHIIGIIISLLVLLIVGLADDKFHNLSPYIRLIAQFLAALIVVLAGVGITFITNPLGGIIRLDTVTLPINFFGAHQIILLADILAIFWIVWVMNMINWSKGVDGQMPGIVVVAATILGILSLKLFWQGDPNQFNIARISFVTAATSLAFLIFNWHPAKIFPGFSGSTILGFMIATLAILSGAKLATAGLVLLVPATDFIYTFWRRVLSGKSPLWGDRGHLHHRLLDLGLTHQQISLFYMLLSAILGAVALTLDSRGKVFAAILVGASLLGGLLWLNFFGGLSKPYDQDNG
ncbi:undecaprenyl/decaprenyl-phosphate alpha-N-acetylglucosaminyl 1-phosphate transferase [Candidatus Daviesbacteria bacterium]|nr:undecaprenyl/decaprenyl-phosphate alpha-N-acetylglucosaminyl 1-phosphate transferase [Candidatus Daviesbacteria bacterium]